MTEHPNISAEEVLRMASLTYAGVLIKTANGTPPGPEAPAALEAARSAILPGPSMPDGVTKALQDLQQVAVLFALDLAEGHQDPSTLQHLEDLLLAALARSSIRFLETVATKKLSDCALDYAKAIIVAEETRAPLGSDAVANAMRAFHLEAAAFTRHAASDEGINSPIPQWVEENLKALFRSEDQETS